MKTITINGKLVKRLRTKILPEAMGVDHITQKEFIKIVSEYADRNMGVKVKFSIPWIQKIEYNERGLSPFSESLIRNLYEHTIRQIAGSAAAPPK